MLQNKSRSGWAPEPASAPATPEASIVSGLLSPGPASTSVIGAASGPEERFGLGVSLPEDRHMISSELDEACTLGCTSDQRATRGDWHHRVTPTVDGPNRCLDRRDPQVGPHRVAHEESGKKRITRKRQMQQRQLGGFEIEPAYFRPSRSRCCHARPHRMAMNQDTRIRRLLADKRDRGLAVPDHPSLARGSC
jgi:hypothetical protein